MGDRGEKAATSRHIVRLLHKRQDDYAADGLAPMRKVVGYVHRHPTQRPKGEINATPWRHPLMNWCHDPA